MTVAQLVRASPCGGECCGFNSRQSPQIKIMTTETETEIRKTIVERGGIPPYIIWSSSFLDMLNGVLIPNSGMPAHCAKREDLDDAVSLYIDVSDGAPGADVKIIQSPRITDSRNVQVYP